MELKINTHRIFSVFKWQTIKQNDNEKQMQMNKIASNDRQMKNVDYHNIRFYPKWKIKKCFTQFFVIYFELHTKYIDSLNLF